MLLMAVINLLLPLFILSTIHVVRRSRYSQIRSGRFRTEELRHFEFSEKQFRALPFKKPHEFVWDDEFYDIQSLKVIEGTYHVKALPDKKDRKLNTLHADLQKVRKKIKGFVGFMPFLFFESSGILETRLFTLNPRSYRLFNFLLPEAPYSSLSTPPPDLV